MSVGRLVCPRCGFPLVEERPARALTPVLAAAALIAAAAAAFIFLVAVPIARGPSSDALSPAGAERRIALRYPHLRYAENAVIACPDRVIEPGGAARCWVLARVGLQRSVTVRLSRHGNQLEIED